MLYLWASECMNITSTGLYDECALKRFTGRVYNRITRLSLVLSIAFPVLIGLPFVVFHQGHSQGLDVLLLFLSTFLPSFYWIRRAGYLRMVIARARRRQGGGVEVSVTLTDDIYECRCGETLIRSRWQEMGAYYLFIGDGIAITEERNPTLLIPSLSKLGVDPAELKEVLRHAGLKDYGTFR